MKLYVITKKTKGNRDELNTKKNSIAVCDAQNLNLEKTLEQ
jgi:hypothetical protein